ncbi:hypothetical protein QYM36_000495 [Artemia franciscana]|uniref:Uncharacterized protein n=1 Tax=Artemia franciscana TaxID=6661 RepID=A0AA88IFZ5_ARTSF|nr:hypothetical protein QYM36_000495 [Artemia franciscana]
MSVTYFTLEEALKNLSSKLEARLVAIFASKSETGVQISAQFSEMKSEIQFLYSKLSEKDKLISELNLRFEHQEQRLLELGGKDRKLNLVVQGLRKEKNGETLEQNLQNLLRSSLEIKDNIQITKFFRVKHKQSSVSVHGNAKKPSLPPVVFSCRRESDIFTIMKSEALKDFSSKLEARLVAISASQSEIEVQISAQFSEMKSEIQLLYSKLSEKDKLISELNSRIEHQEQRLLELEG